MCVDCPEELMAMDGGAGCRQEDDPIEERENVLSMTEFRDKKEKALERKIIDKAIETANNCGW